MDWTYRPGTGRGQEHPELCPREPPVCWAGGRAFVKAGCAQIASGPFLQPRDGFTTHRQAAALYAPQPPTPSRGGLVACLYTQCWDVDLTPDVYLTAWTWSTARALPEGHLGEPALGQAEPATPVCYVDDLRLGEASLASVCQMERGHPHSQAKMNSGTTGDAARCSAGLVLGPQEVLGEVGWRWLRETQSFP